MTYRRLALVCFMLVIIVSTVLSQEDCDKPLQFTSKATLDKYIRCLKAKAVTRYGKRMVPNMFGRPKVNWYLSEKPTDSYYSNGYRMMNNFDN